jgi:hypothetical protein
MGQLLAYGWGVDRDPSAAFSHLVKSTGGDDSDSDEVGPPPGPRSVMTALTGSATPVASPSQARVPGHRLPHIPGASASGSGSGTPTGAAASGAPGAPGLGGVGTRRPGSPCTTASAVVVAGGQAGMGLARTPSAGAATGSVGAQALPVAAGNGLRVAGSPHGVGSSSSGPSGSGRTGSASGTALPQAWAQAGVSVVTSPSASATAAGGASGFTGSPKHASVASPKVARAAADIPERGTACLAQVCV